MGDIDRSLRFPRARDGSEAGCDKGASGGEYCVPASTSCTEEGGDDLVDRDRDRLCDWTEDSRGWDVYLAKAAGEGGLMYGRGDWAIG